MSDLPNILRTPDKVKLQTKAPITPQEVERERVRVMKGQEKHYKHLFKKLAEIIKSDQQTERQLGRERKALELEQAAEVRRIKNALKRERLSGATSLAAATRAILGNRPEASTGGQLLTSDGRTSFHFELTTLSKKIDGKHSAVAHLRYISRGSAVARLEISTDPQAIEAARLMGYAAREGAVAEGTPNAGTNEREPEERLRGAMLFGSIGATRKEQEAYWHAVAKSERTPTRSRFLPKEPVTDSMVAAEIASRYSYAQVHPEWDTEAKAFAFVPPDNLDKKVVRSLEAAFKRDLGARFISSRGGRVQCRLIMELPHELTTDAMLAMCDEFTEVFRKEGLPYFGAIHKPDGDNNPLNWHVHLAFHDRPAKLVEINGRSIWDFEVTERNSYTHWTSHPMRQEKARWISDKSTPAKLRKLWCDIANKHLAAAGVKKRWFHERYEKVGIRAKALKRLPQKVYAAEMRGIQTKPGRERIRQEQAQSQERRRALKAAGGSKNRIDEQEQIAIKSTDQATRLLTRRAALKREITKRETLLQSNSARSPEKMRARLARDREALKIVNAMLAEIDGRAKPGGRAANGPFKGLNVQAAFAPRDGLADSWEQKRIAFAPTTAEIGSREHEFRDHPEGEMERNNQRTGENIAERQLARLQRHFPTNADEKLRQAFSKMKTQARLGATVPDAHLLRVHQNDSERLIAQAQAREIEILSRITGLRSQRLLTPEMQHASIQEHVQTMYRAERASALLVQKGLTRETFEPSPLGASGETPPQAPTGATKPSIPPTPSDLNIAMTDASVRVSSMPTIASGLSMASTPVVASVAAEATVASVASAPSIPSAPQAPAKPIPTYDQFAQRVYQDWTNALLSFRTTPDREKHLDRVFVAKTLQRAFDLSDHGESMMALDSAQYANILDAKRLNADGKRALYESAAFEAAKLDPDQEVRMQRLAMVGEIVDSSRKIENETGVFYRLQKDLAFALAEPVFAPYVGDEVTRYALGLSSSEVFATAPKRDYRQSNEEARQYDTAQKDVYVDIPVNVFRDRLHNLRNTVIDLPTAGRTADKMLDEADKRFKAYIETTDVSMLTEPPGVTLGVIPVGPPGEERAINMMRARQNLPPIKLPDNVAKNAHDQFLAPLADGSTLQGPEHMLEWASKKFTPIRDAGLLQTSENARDKALAPESSFARSIAPLDLKLLYRAMGVTTATATPMRATSPSQPSAPKVNPIKSRGIVR